MSLPKIEDITKLSTRVTRILGQNGPSKFVLQGTNTYVIGTGTERILLDTAEGRPEYTPLLEKVLHEERCTIKHILLSHWHHDHVEGLPSVLQMLRSHQKEAPTVSKFQHPSDEDGWQVLTDKDEVQVEGATLRAVHTPGHTTDHLAFHLLEDNVLFSGDHILGGSTSVFEDLSTYMKSLEKCLDVGADTLFPGHGLEITDASSMIQQYLQHRQMRENQIIKQLQSGQESQSAMDIVKVMYKDVREDLHFAAEHGVKQHLEKLRKEGKVRMEELDEEKWRLTSSARI